MSKHKLSEKEARNIADKFIREWYFEGSGKVREFTAFRVEKHPSEPNCWALNYDLADEGSKIDGLDIGVVVDKNGVARIREF